MRKIVAPMVILIIFYYYFDYIGIATCISQDSWPSFTICSRWSSV